MMLNMNNQERVNNSEDRDESNNMLLVSEGSAELNSSKYDSSKNTNDMKSRIQSHNMVQKSKRLFNSKSFNKKPQAQSKIYINEDSFESTMKSQSSNNPQ